MDRPVLPAGLSSARRRSCGRESFRAALRSARERGQPPTVAYQLEGMAIALAGLGRYEDALEAAGWARSVRRTAGPAVNHWYRALLARSLSESRAALHPRASAEAYARGLGLALDAAVDAALAFADDHRRRASTSSLRSVTTVLGAAAGHLDGGHSPPA